jgi:hypothetical protein
MANTCTPPVVVILRNRKLILAGNGAAVRCVAAGSGTHIKAFGKGNVKEIGNHEQLRLHPARAGVKVRIACA